jgi:hypothetical protein
MAVCVRGVMSELVEARDVDGHLYVSALGLTQALEKAREQGKEIERAKWLCMLTPYERRMVRVREACIEADISFDDLMGTTRTAKVCRVRHRLFYEFNSEGMSLPEIGRFFNRDHTTVLHGVNAEKERRNGLGNTGEFRQAIEAAEAASAIREAGSDDRHG